MRKLNITKERFEKSNYFQRKYGKLEYVSESGNLYKTNKGKILKFKESRTSNWKEVDLVWDSDSDLLPDTVFVQVNQGSPSEIDLKYELEKRYDAEIIDINTYHVSRIVSRCDCFKWTRGKLKPFDPSRITGKELRTTWESTRKFGKKFVKESGEPEGWSSEIHDKAYDKMARNLAKQIKEKVKLPAVAHEGGRRIGVYPWAKNLGDWNCWDEKKAQPFVDKIMNAFPGMLDYYGPGDLYGRPGLMFRLNFKYLFDKVNSGEFPYKESGDDIANDPALVCPYCGGNNCEVSIGTDDLNFTNLDRLQGETFNVECWCNDCDKPYNVTVELRVKDVYPNEDADL